MPTTKILGFGQACPVRKIRPERWRRVGRGSPRGEISAWWFGVDRTPGGWGKPIVVGGLTRGAQAGLPGGTVGWDGERGRRVEDIEGRYI